MNTDSRIGCYCEMYHDNISRYLKATDTAEYFRPNMMVFSHLAMLSVDQGFSPESM